ncbi:MAG TPA: 4Fe-4S dicluster domain-containing protein [Candidatus Bathyarchaeia archaeon]|nr:4Fe-4S dicluster domain-containing protein [Candidatus Bathyarchaeia archaeon]
MPIKELKIDNENELTIQRLLHAKHYELTLTRTLCVGCEICKTICPREAIDVKKQPKQQGQKTQRPIIDVNPQKCTYCGMCEPICPFDAIRVNVNGQHLVSVVEKESFPRLIHEIEVDASKCSLDCVECEKACPLNLIKVALLTPEGKQLPHEKLKTYSDRNDLKVQVNILKEQSPCCRLCEVKCPEGAIHVRKIFHGVLDINVEKCPPNCQDCLDVCPIPSALFLNSDGKVYPNAAFCVFCGACKIVCPADGALVMERRSVYHTPIKSGAWNKAIEKLTSTREYSKESQTKRAAKVQQSIERKSLLKGVENA